MPISINPLSRPFARLPFAAAVVALFASVLGVAQAAEFDEKVQAPAVRSADQLRAHMRVYSAREAQARLGGLGALLADRSLARERFEMSWDLQRALDAKRPLGDLSEQGLIDRGDGSYSVDLVAHPEWGDPAVTLTGLLPALDPPGLGAELTRRGMQADDLAKLQEFLKTHDAKLTIAAATAPISVSFSRVVKKFDKLKRPVPDALVMAYIYQREGVAAETQRKLASSLLDSVGPAGTRVLQSYLGEMQNSGVYAPSDQRAGIDGLLANLRLPDFEQKLAAEAKGVTP